MSDNSGHIERGYVWGKIWSVLLYISAGIEIIAAISLFVNPGNMPASSAATVGVVLLVLSVIQLFTGYGMWNKKSWALIITYVILLLSVISGVIQLVRGFAGVLDPNVSLGAVIIAVIIKFAIDALWFCYFYKRRGEFS